MQRKAFVTCAAIFLAQNVIANEDNIELTTIPDGPLGTEVPAGEEVKEKENGGPGPDSGPTVDENGDGIKPPDGVHDDHDHDDEHAGHDHEEHAMMMNHMLSEKCLSKSDPLGVFIEGQDTAFDQT